jgi:hypothetical protein
MTRASSPDHEVSLLCLFLFDSRGVPVDLDQYRTVDHVCESAMRLDIMRRGGALLLEIQAF